MGSGELATRLLTPKPQLGVADRTGDPALVLLSLDALIGLEGSDELATRARAVTDCIYERLPNEVMRQCFTESEVMQRIRALGNGHPGS